MWSLPETLVLNNPELGLPETEHTRTIKALNKRNALAETALKELVDPISEDIVLKDHEEDCECPCYDRGRDDEERWMVSVQNATCDECRDDSLTL